jgi:hypothetical protein
MDEVLAAVDACDLLVAAFSFCRWAPAPLIDLLLGSPSARGARRTRQALAAIVNCGFPETAHCRPAAEIMRTAAQAGFRFLGCLALG